ncbi:MAG: 23S rRNA (adenine(2503)-C(2))-methyltransferase RlmN [Alphaproteobacteria bacterium]|nr:23S rRNA (adenine(2503)-C(2))-methyltransferase RlmN [Alphaproteobacteria bacterium]
MMPASTILSDEKNLIGFDRAMLQDLITDLGEQKFRANQLFQWLYHHGAQDFDAMHNLAKSLRVKLHDAGYYIIRPEIVNHQKSVDGTQKWLLRLSDGNEIETVYIPEKTRGTLCISSQIGCTLNCSFCHTGTQRLVRNLTAGEIVGQVMKVRDELGEWPSPHEQRKISNIVLMGMGEPLYNYDNVARAVKLICDDEGICLSRRRVTLSTSGVVPLIEKVGDELGCVLAISLHAVRDDLRDMLVPINKKWNIDALMQACRTYPGLKNSKRITFEYVMLKDINDSEADARALVQLIAGIPAKINLIPFNPWPGNNYQTSSDEQIKKFAKIVLKAGYASPVRTPRGADIMSACGQLKSSSLHANLQSA